MKQKAKLFFAWTPLHIIMTSACVKASNDNCSYILLWIGSKNNIWKEILSKQKVWDRIIDLSEWGLIGFWRYQRNYKLINKYCKHHLSDILSDYDISEISIASDDEYFSLIIIKIISKYYKNNAWENVSLYEDGYGIYLHTKQRHLFAHITKIIIDSLLMRNIIPKTIRYFSNNPYINKIYCLYPELLPCTKNKETININRYFQYFINEYSRNIKNISALPPNSGLILSENLAPKFISFKDEERYLTGMVNYLYGECKVDNIFTKYHHYDTQGKRDTFRRREIKEIASADLPYEILHSHLKPAYVISMCSAAIFHSPYYADGANFIAYCSSEKRLEIVEHLFKKKGITVI